MTKFIINKLTYFNSFRQSILDYAFKSQSKDYRENLELAFFDSTGKRYYRFINMQGMPLKRFELILKQQEILKEGLSRKDGEYLSEWIKTAELAIEKSKTPKVDFGKLLHSLNQRSKLFDENLLLELLCLTYIREDENPAEFSEVLHQEKITQIKTDLEKKAGGLYDFFQQAGLKDYLPSEDGMQLDYEAFTKSSQEKIKKMTDELQKTSLLLQGLKE